MIGLAEEEFPALFGGEESAVKDDNCNWLNDVAGVVWADFLAANDEEEDEDDDWDDE